MKKINNFYLKIFFFFFSFNYLTIQINPKKKKRINYKYLIKKEYLIDIKIV
jgi:hypothetical protein